MAPQELSQTPTFEPIHEEQNRMAHLSRTAIENMKSTREWVTGIAASVLATLVVSPAQASPVHYPAREIGAKTEHITTKKHSNVFGDSVIGKVSFIASSTGQTQESQPRTDSGQGSEGSSSSTPTTEAGKKAALKEAIKTSAHYFKVYPYTINLNEGFAESRHPHPKGAHIWGHINPDTSRQGRDDYFYTLKNAHYCAMLISGSGGDDITFPKPTSRTRTGGHYKPSVSMPGATVTFFAAPMNQKCEQK
ncbi:MAG: hypothetical protein JWL89_713 [Candidatus Saccharibacteria bacterium]|nr:hypothetical protein [Candidatus Saccharibacteria bacterium]